MYRKIRFLLFGLLLLILLSGCFEVSTLIKVKKDGSGTIEETVLFNEGMMSGMMSGFGMEAEKETNEEQENSFYDEEKLKKDITKYGENVSYVSSKPLEKNGKVGYEVIYAFEDITKLTVNENPAGSAMGNMPMMGTTGEQPSENLSFEFKKGKTSELTIKYPKLSEEIDKAEEEVPEEVEDMEMDPSEMEMMKAMFAGMKFSMKFEFDGKITKTNATNRDGSTITFVEMDFDEILKDTENFKKLNSLKENQKEMKKIMKNFPGVKIEMNEELKVQFK